MKSSVGDTNLAGGEGLTKARKLLHFGREDLSSLDVEKEDYETQHLRDVLRRKLLEMQRNKAKTI